MKQFLTKLITIPTHTIVRPLKLGSQYDAAAASVMGKVFFHFVPDVNFLTI